MINAWADRLYRRRKSRYLVWWSVFAHLLLQGLIQPFVPLFGLVFEFDAGQQLRLSLWFAVTVWLAGVVVVVAARRTFLRETTAYLAGDAYDAERVWGEVVPAALRYSIALGLLSCPASIVAIWVVLGASAPLATVVAWTALVTVANAAAVGAFVTGNRLFTRPLAAEVSARHPEVVGTRTQPSVNRQLMASVFSTITIGVFVGAGFAAGATSPAARGWTVTIGIAIASAAAMVLFRVLAGTPIVQPIDDLTAATRKIAAGDLSGTVDVTSEDELGRLAQEFNRMALGLRERARLQAAFGSYVDPALADRLLDQTDYLFHGESVEATILFLDIRDFTPFTESHAAVDVVALLNQLFGRVVPIVRAHGGHANKFLGDGLMAVFGTPYPLEDHASCALAAAREILAAVEEEFLGDVRIGIGLDTGTVVAGTIGGGGKLEFTVVGDTVNVAARVESCTKEAGRPLLFTEATRAALRDGTATEEVGEVAVKGKSVPLVLHGLAGSRAAVRLPPQPVWGAPR